MKDFKFKFEENEILADPKCLTPHKSKRIKHELPDNKLISLFNSNRYRLHQLLEKTSKLTY